MAGDKEYISPREAAEILSMTTKQLRKWANEGMLTHHKTLGGHRRYKREEIERLINESLTIREGNEHENSDQ